jgi:exopolysaccharide biosynthesis polyprenyl glycosylphosphotransferase
MAIGLGVRLAATERAESSDGRGLRRVRPMELPRACSSARLAWGTLALMDGSLALLCLVALCPGAPSGWSWFLPPALLLSLAICGHYHPRISPSLSRQARSVLAGSAVAVVLLAATGGTRTHLVSYLPLAVCLSAALLLDRALFNWCLKVMRSRGLLTQRTLVVGAGRVGVTLASTMLEHPEYGLEPVGFLDDIGAEKLPLPVFGGAELLNLVLLEEHIERVVIAYGIAREANMVKTIRACEDASVDIHVVPRFFELGLPPEGKELDEVWGIPLVWLRGSPWHRLSWSMKRVMDVAVAGLGILLLSPVYLSIALAVKLSSRGPVFFTQRRVGRHGKIVLVHKFRTMHVHPESDTEWKPDEEHVTVLGGLLRQLSLDELPQLFDVLSGAMSLVGPRPERPFFVERFRGDIAHYDARHRVPVGITGLAQVNGLRGNTSIEDRARFDNRYIESWSLWLDVVIMVRTLTAVLRDVVRSRRTHHGEPPGIARFERSEERRVGTSSPTVTSLTPKRLEAARGSVQVSQRSENGSPLASQSASSADGAAEYTEAQLAPAASDLRG